MVNQFLLYILQTNIVHLSDYSDKSVISDNNDVPILQQYLRSQVI